MAEHRMLVFTRPVEGREADFHTWYDTTHVPDLLGVPGVVAAQRFAASASDDPAAAPPHPFLTLYELDRPVATVMETLFERVGSGEIVMSDALDMGNMAIWAYEAIGERQTAGAPLSS